MRWSLFRSRRFQKRLQSNILKTRLGVEPLEGRLLLSTGPTLVDMTAQAGILANPINPTFNISWADVNGDGRADLSVGRWTFGSIHPWMLPNLYVNQDKGTFTDVFGQAFPNTLIQDIHGAVWADVGNSGLPSFYQVPGANHGTGLGPKQFFVNINGHMIDEGPATGLSDPLGRGRDPAFFDWNRDGMLDALLVKNLRPDGQSPSQLLAQTASGFQDVTASAGLSGLSSLPGTFAEVADFGGHGANDLIFMSLQQAPQFFSESNGLFTQVANFLPADTNITDLAVADFNNDGYLDAFLTTRITASSDATQFSSTQIGAELYPRAKQDQGFTFQSNGNISIDLQNGTNGFQTPQAVFIGSSGIHPSGLTFTLDPNDPAVQGIQPHQPGQNGLYVGYDTTNQVWNVILSGTSSDAPGGLLEQGLVVNTVAPISGFSTVGFSPSPHLSRNYLLLYHPATGQLVDATQQAGLGALATTSSVVAGDFTNDGYNDLYLTQETGVASLPDIYYHNNGNGTFTQMDAFPGGPTGPVGPAYGPFNYGKKVITADYNQDGWLDLFTNSSSMQTFGANYLSNPNRLLENASGQQGLTNHWIELNLQGTVSNRQGVGAMVHVYANDLGDQVQEETLGLHHFAQSSSTLHFGLAQNTTIDKIVIDWPSGIVQELDNLSADQILTVEEPGGNTMATARTIPVYLNFGPYQGHVDNANPSDYYRVAVAAASNLRIDLFNLTADANVQLLDANGGVLAQSNSGGSSKELLSPVGAGTFYLRVMADSSGTATDYALRLTDESSSDSLAPVASDLQIDSLASATVLTPSAPTLSAWIDDTGTGNTKVVAAEYFIDTVGTPGTGISLAPQEGQFSGSIEYVTASLDATTYGKLSAGTHTLYVRGEDAAGNWGATATATFTKDLVTHFQVSTPASTTAGANCPVTVTALDATNKPVNGYQGTISFSSSDPQAVLPTYYTFTADDAGVHTFNVVLGTAGMQALTVADTTIGSVTGTKSGITVTPGVACTFTVAGYPSPHTANLMGKIVVTALDAYGNTATGYCGTVHFTTTSAKAVLPADYTFTAADNGVHTFYPTLRTAGSQSITATDTVTGSITGSQTGIAITAGTAQIIKVSGFPSSVTAGTSAAFWVTVRDAFGNIATGYRGTVHFTSSDASALLPADYTFTSSDAGVHRFRATLETPGTVSLTATDTTDPQLSGSEAGIAVGAAPRGSPHPGATSDAADDRWAEPTWVASDLAGMARADVDALFAEASDLASIASPRVWRRF
jgi:hypothetical protein